MLGNDRNPDYKYTILVLETQYFSCCLLHFINSYLGIYLKTKTKNKKNSKTNKQTKQNKKENKRKVGSRRSVARFELGTSGLTGLHINHYAIEEGYMIHRKVSS